jgi:hypothetical protein
MRVDTTRTAAHESYHAVVYSVAALLNFHDWFLLQWTVLERFDVHTLFGRHFKLSCLATLVLFFYHSKSMKLEKIGRKCAQNKIRASHKFVKPISHILIHLPF